MAVAACQCIRAGGLEEQRLRDTCLPGVKEEGSAVLSAESFEHLLRDWHEADLDFAGPINLTSETLTTYAAPISRRCIRHVLVCSLARTAPSPLRSLARHVKER